MVQSMQRRSSDPVLDLLQAGAEGDKAAIEELVRQCRPTLVRAATARGASEPEAVADAALLKLIAARDRLEFKTANHLWAYLHKITRTEVVDEHRRRKPETPVDWLGAEHSSAVESDFSHGADDRVWVKDLLDQLTSDQRQILELRFLDDLSIEEAAVRTGRTKTAVKALQRRALRAVLAGLVAAAAIAVVFAFGRSPMPLVQSIAPAIGIDRDEPAEDRETLVVEATDETPTAQAGPVVDPEPTLRLSDAAVGEFAPEYNCWGTSGTVAQLQEQGFDVTIGTPDDDLIDVSDGERPDFVMGLGGDDTIITGRGEDIVCGGAGADDLTGGSGDDLLVGGNGNDRLRGHGGNDRLAGGGGDDYVAGGKGDDLLRANAGNDRLVGAEGDDRLIGAAGQELVIDVEEGDELVGLDGEDLCRLLSVDTDEVDAEPVEVPCSTLIHDQPEPEGEPAEEE